MQSTAVIELTADGSHTIFVPELGAHYHSTHGAIAESTHIFINMGLKHIAEKKQNINLLEIGVGTGLNLLLTALYALENKAISIRYTGLEKYPLSPEIVAQLNYPSFLQNTAAAKEVLSVIHQEYYQTYFREHIKNLKPEIIHQDFEKWIELVDSSAQFDLIYFDAFAPSHQPDMWAKAVFESLYSLLNTNGVLVTFCAKGIFKRMLRNIGFKVESLPGPPGKREMTRITKF